MGPLDNDLLARLDRIAAALDRIAPAGRAPLDVDAADAFVWQPQGEFMPVERVNRVAMVLLLRAASTLEEKEAEVNAGSRFDAERGEEVDLVRSA
mgnify:CR=1 FL=1